MASDLSLPGGRHRRDVLGEYLPVLLIWSCLVLLPFGRLVELPVLVMAGLGLGLAVWRGRSLIRLPGVRWFVALFLLAWLPVLFSALDAVEPGASWRIVLNHLRFLFAGLFMCVVLADARRQARLVRWSAWLLMLWVVDALVQWGVGVNLLGFEPLAGRINGIFGDGGLRLGIALAVFAALTIEHARRCWPPLLAAASVLALCAVVLVSASRASWISLAAIAGCYFAWQWYRRRRFPFGILAVALVATALASTALYYASPAFAKRVQHTARAFTAERDPVHDSVSHRFWIWGVAVETYLANPFNGVGARGFRHAYDTYTTSDDPYLRLDPPQRPTHTHQLWLEVATETGTLGLAALLALHALALTAFVRAKPPTRARMAPFGICLAAAYFPINTHLALYSAFWSQILWWLWASYAAALGGADDDPTGSNCGRTTVESHE